MAGSRPCSGPASASARAPAQRRHARDRSRRPRRGRGRQGRSAARSGLERRALVHDRHANRSRTCRSPTAASRRSPCSRPASDRRQQHAARIGGGGDPNIMMDGVSTMDTGSNRPLLQMNIESIAEVKVLTSGYQAEYGRASGVQITAVTKSGTNRFRGVALRRRAKLGLEHQQQDQHPQRRPQGDRRRRTTGAIRSAARSASPAATTRCSSSTARSSRRARRGNNVVRFRMPTPARTRRRLLADRPTTTATCTRTSRTRS